jgi:putative addiction module component (TIGR02574 family)
VAPTLKTLGIDRLSVAEKLELIERIWDSLPPNLYPEELPGWHLTELKKRLAPAESHPGEGTPWREALSRLEA